MSNLGGYQVMTKLAKKVGGPMNLLGLTMVGGYGIIRIVEAASKKGVKIVKKQYKRNEMINNGTKIIFEVTSAGKNDNGLELCTGDKYRVLEADEESILIEKLGDFNNPYFVSADFLRTISDFI